MSDLILDPGTDRERIAVTGDSYVSIDASPTPRLSAGWIFTSGNNQTCQTVGEVLEMTQPEVHEYVIERTRAVIAARIEDCPEDLAADTLAAELAEAELALAGGAAVSMARRGG